MEKPNGNMNVIDAIVTMCKGNPGAIMVLTRMMESPTGPMDIPKLHEMGIYGSYLNTLWNDCCGRDPNKFTRTLTMILSDVFTQEEIRHNLKNRRDAQPFIDDSIEMDGIPPYGEDFGPDHPKWDEWCKDQKESYQHRIAKYNKRRRIKESVIRVVAIVLLVSVPILGVTRCNREMLDIMATMDTMDTTCSFSYARIYTPDGQILVEGKVSSWRDFEDVDQLQVVINGTTYRSHASLVVLSTE